jgi:signal transduction histidine kinase
VSERPKATDPDEPRLRRPWSRFRDLPIWSKLGVIMIVPTLATIAIGTNGLIGHRETAAGAGRAGNLADLSQSSAELIHHLQDERVAAVRVLGASGDEADERSEGYTQARDAVDTAMAEFQREGDVVSGAPASYRDLIGQINDQLSRLPQTRGQVSEAEIGIIATAGFYEELIVNLLSLRDLAAQVVAEETTDNALSDRMRAAVAVSQAKEFLSQRRVVGHVVLIRGAYNPYLRTEYIGAGAGETQALQTFGIVATATDATVLDAAQQSGEARQSQIFQGNLDSLDSGSLETLPWDATAWDETLAAHADLIRDAERALDEAVVADADTVRAEAEQQLLVQAMLLLLVLLLAILLAWLVARSMVNSLRTLRQGALSVAQYGLPQAVTRLRDPSVSTQLSPAEVATQVAEPLPVHSRDEFGQVAEAFNAVHLEAVRTAAEQAQLRSSVAAMFVNLARRSQILVDRLISQLDRLERSEEDPDRLAELFQLDHLATRMRRTDENLLVLAGADSTRVQREAATMIDVLRAAQSEVEQYTRIEFGAVDRDLEVAAHAVNDLVHLVAELLDNATVFSPPDTHVMVEARRVGDRAVLYVEDRGLGMSPEMLAEINQRLAEPPLVDVAVSRMMGLVVVGRLAARHGVKVELRRASNRGTVADVTLPSAVLVPTAIAGRSEPPPIRLEPLHPSDQPEHPAASSNQLALERGPSAQRSGSGFPASASFPPMPGYAPAPSHQPAPPGVPPAGRDGGPRSLPAWSDLVGPSSGSNGADHTATSWSGMTPVRGTGPGAEQPPPDQAWQSPSGQAARPPRAAAPPPPPPAAAPPAAAGSPPLPRRQPHAALPGTDPTPASPPPTQEAPIPQQRPAEGAAPAAPPIWPPAAPESFGSASTSAPTPAPASPAAADQTTEFPKPYMPPTPPPPPTGDRTMELPIFRELESVWFRTGGHHPPRPDGKQGAVPAVLADDTSRFAVVSAGTPPVRESVEPAAAPASQSGPSATSDEWRTAADDGWRAASTAAESHVDEMTSAGLPKRRPMAQLVPGGVARDQTVDVGADAASGVQRRSPEAVRGLLSAYHRGVQRGRGQTGGTDDDASGSGGPQGAVGRGDATAGGGMQANQAGKEKK